LSESVQGVWFREQPVRGATTFATLGLSHHLLSQPTGVQLRIELLLACRNEFVSAFKAMSVLADVSDDIRSLHQAPSRGTVFGPRGRFFAESEMAALYCSAPVYFAGGLARFSGFSEPFVPIWLVPITALEAKFVHTHGWSRFEDILVGSDPDLLDLRRPSVVDHA
jgi:hypothetical protein